MKNTIKLFGIIALVAVIGFSMAGCDEDKATATVLKVVNQSANAITGVKATSSGGRELLNRTGLNITESQEFDIDLGDFDDLPGCQVDLTVPNKENWGFVYGVLFKKNRTTTVTLTSSGEVQESNP